MTLHESGCTVIKASRIKIEDTFGRFIETKATSLQEDTKSDKARNIQETIAENFKYFLKEVEKNRVNFQCLRTNSGWKLC